VLVELCNYVHSSRTGRPVCVFLNWAVQVFGKQLSCLSEQAMAESGVTGELALKAEKQSIYSCDVAELFSMEPHVAEGRD